MSVTLLSVRFFSTFFAAVILANVSGCQEHTKRTIAPTAQPAAETSPPASAFEQDSAAAVAVIVAYYEAISAHDYQRAYEYWDAGGGASGKAFAEFEASFRGWQTVDVTPGTPSPVDAAAGSRFITIPVVVTTHLTSGEEQQLGGTYDLRYTVVDGATKAQRHWHLYSAQLAQIQ